ncbi:bis(5'-nucleosyl)-tetraphosphatase [Humisphaera borealis]|uniref:Bis(5'-nucleosyl)-tetraphosphatase [asymmetrical] n=1 Tax=Humisphaera borealis TaxID=2807512 RepID=A0A7M2X417_9BACT|nr:NUDIX domain-containing protein [Humisphaera borealis]QOV92192.1 NUDIX domain-containing protein [Humisphaera borealis]
MPATTERSAGFILFHRKSEGADGEVRYLLLDYGGHWDFAKGHVEPGESDMQAALRELAEETHIRQVAAVPGFAREISYFFRHRKRGLVQKSVVFFLAESATDQVILSDEHVGHDWLLAAEALHRVTYANARAVLRDADAFLRRED